MGNHGIFCNDNLGTSWTHWMDWLNINSDGNLIWTFVRIMIMIWLEDEVDMMMKMMMWIWCLAEISVKIGVGIKQEFKQAATLARQPGNAELSTNEKRDPRIDQSQSTFGPICNFSASSAWTKMGGWEVYSLYMQQWKLNAILQRFWTQKANSKSRSRWNQSASSSSAQDIMEILPNWTATQCNLIQCI